MKAVIVHAGGRRTDLSAAVDPDTYAELETGHYSRTSPSLWCGSCGGSIYIRHGSTHTDELFGAHHSATDCTADLTIRQARMSDEHKHQAEYHAQTAMRAGYSADLEVTTSGRTRVDVVIDGRIGIEVQRSALKKAAATDRTVRSIGAGLTSVTWFTDRDGHPQWLGHVPSYRSILSLDRWKEIPPLGTAGAAGLRMIEAVRCGTRTICPHLRSGSCGRFIAWPVAWNGLLVDNVVEGLAAGYIRPVRLGKQVQLLSTASIGLYEELTGIRLSYNPGAAKAALWPSAPEECDRLLSVPADAPAPVREWFAAELGRVQQAREESQQSERDRLARLEQTERRQAAHDADQAGRRKYWDMQRKARQMREGMPQVQREFATIDEFLSNSQLCTRPGCHSGPRHQPGRTMDPSGLCYACRTGR